MTENQDRLDNIAPVSESQPVHDQSEPQSLQPNRPKRQATTRMRIGNMLFNFTFEASGENESQLWRTIRVLIQSVAAAAAVITSVWLLSEVIVRLGSQGQ